MPILERLLLPHLPAGAHILDLGCGTGHLAQVLCEKGYHITGIDISAEMVREAQEVAPQAVCFQQDMRTFRRERTFHAAVALFATMNHLLDVRDFKHVLENVRCSLRSGGWFVFDFNTPSGLKERWQGTEVVVKEDMTVISQGTFDETLGVAETTITTFRPEGGAWLRTDTVIKLRGYEENNVKEWIRATGFERVVMHRITGKVGEGRVFALCRKPDSA